MSAETLDVLRADERRLFSLWRDTPGTHPLVHIRAAAWRKALQVLNAEMGARARMVRPSA